MSYNPRESVVERHLYVQVKTVLHGECVKLTKRRGWPDRLVVVPGAMFFVETKRPKGSRFEPLQLRIHAKLRRMGHTVEVAYTKAEVDTLITRQYYATFNK